MFNLQINATSLLKYQKKSTWFSISLSFKPPKCLAVHPIKADGAWAISEEERWSAGGIYKLSPSPLYLQHLWVLRGASHILPYGRTDIWIVYRYRFLHEKENFQEAKTYIPPIFRRFFRKRKKNQQYPGNGVCFEERSAFSNYSAWKWWEWEEKGRQGGKEGKGKGKGKWKRRE